MATKYISPSGSNGAAGTLGAPWQTLTYALANTSSGDTIILLDGTYTAADQTIANRTIRAQNDLMAIIDLATSEKVWTVSQTVTIEGLVFIDAAQTGNAILKQSGAGLTLNVNRCWFEDCLIASNDTGNYSGLIGPNTTATVNVVATVFFNCGRMSGASAGVCIGCIYPGGTIILTVSNCVFYTDRASGTAPTHFVIYYLGAPVAGTQLVAKNNIMDNAGGTTVNSFYTYQIGEIVEYNCLHNTANINLNAEDVSTGTGNITSDPLFVDAANGDFHLRPDSPCVDTGTLL